jgi:hypothetical protein
MTGSAAAWPRTPFNSASFIRCLGDLGLDDGPGAVASAQQPLAARLGAWLNWTDAIALSAALQAPGETSAHQAPPAPPAPPALGFDAAQACARVRQELTQGVMADAVFAASQPGPSRTPVLPLPLPLPRSAPASAFLPYRRGYLAQQRAMDERIGPLRTQVRAALATRSPALRQLAALDAALDTAWSPRERHLLAKVPALLERHHARLHAGHPAASGLAAFCQDARGVLLAEIDFRLQATAGMVEALSLEGAGQP